MTVGHVQRLVQRVQQKPGGRTTMKLRTLLSTFGYSRRSPEIVEAVQQQLAAQGITVDFSVSSPASLDARIALVLASAQSKGSSAPPAGKSLEEHPIVEMSDVPVNRGTETQRTASDPNPPRHLSEPVRIERALPHAVENIAEGPIEAEPPRSFAARLFRTALSLFDSEPPTILALQQNEPGPAVPRRPEGAAAAGKPVSVPNPIVVDAEASALVPGMPTTPARPAPIRDLAPPSSAVAAVTVAPTPTTPELSYVAEQTIRATVLVKVEHGHGSGFMVHPDGLVVTACHVLDGATGIAKNATIRLDDGRESKATLIRAHRSLDFALLWLDTPGPYPVLAVGDVRKTRYAETVLAVGHPGIPGEEQALTNTVSTGVVANPACSQRGIDWIQMTTDIDPGNSGGPLVNCRGEVIGVNCWKFLAVAAAKMALPLDYLDEDLAAAAQRGRDGYATGRVCSMCGWFEDEPADWFCPTCGAAYAPASEAV